MAWSVLQSASASTTSVTFGSNLSSGTKLIAYCGSVTFQAIPAPTAVKDGSNNAFTEVAVTTGTAGPSSFWPNLSVWVLDTPAGDVGTAPTITVTWSGSPANTAVLVQEVSGLAAGTGIDGTAGLFGSGATSSSQSQPAYSSSASNEFLISAGCWDGVNQSAALSGYTLDANSIQPSGSEQLAVGYANSTGGAESGTWTGVSNAGDVALIVLALPLPAAGAPPVPLPSLPGRTWLRQFRHPQALLPPPVPPAPAPLPFAPGQTWRRQFQHPQLLAPPPLTGISGQAQPLPTRQPRRQAARGQWRGFTSTTTNLLNGNQPGGVVRRRTAARAYWRGGPVPPQASRPVTGTGLVKRRTAARAYWQPTRTATTNLLSGSPPGGIIRRRAASRVVWSGFVSTTVNATGPPPPAPPPLPFAPGQTWRRQFQHPQLLPPAPPPAQAPVNGQAQPPATRQPRRYPARAVWRGFVSSTTNLLNGQAQPLATRQPRRYPARAVWRPTGTRTTNLQSGNAPGGMVKRRPPQRGAWRGYVSRTTNAPPPAFQVARSTASVADPRDGTASVTAPFTSAASVTDPRDGTPGVS